MKHETAHQSFSALLVALNERETEMMRERVDGSEMQVSGARRSNCFPACLYEPRPHSSLRISHQKALSEQNSSRITFVLRYLSSLYGGSLGIS